jgi:hypothetical protein
MAPKLSAKQKRALLRKLENMLDDYLEPSGGWLELINDHLADRLSKAEYEWAASQTYPTVRAYGRVES